MKTSSLINARRMEMFQRMRFNPIRGMDPERLSTQIDQFHYGYLRDFALTMEAIENRDDKLKCVAPKRKKGRGTERVGSADPGRFGGSQAPG